VPDTHVGEFPELSRFDESDAFGRALGKVKAFDLVSLAAEELHSVSGTRRQIAATYEMGRHRPANLEFDVINLLRLQPRADR